MPTLPLRRRRPPTAPRSRTQLDAPSEDALRDELLDAQPRGQADQAEEDASRARAHAAARPAPEIMHFSRQMAAFVRAGIPITEALEVVEDGSSNKRFRQILATMREEINNGVPFSDALAEHAQIFPPYYIGILQVGGDDRSARRRRSSSSRATSSATSTRKSKIKAAMLVPDGDRRACRSSPS